MANIIDVKTLSKKDIKHLIHDLIESEIITHQLLLEIVEYREKKIKI